jgi:hypothetical protein
VSKEPDLFATSDKRTIELCGEELRPGIRCILLRGHAEEHEFHDSNHTLPVRWKSGER